MSGGCASGEPGGSLRCGGVCAELFGVDRLRRERPTDFLTAGNRRVHNDDQRGVCVFVLCHCQNKSPSTWLCKTTHVYYLTVL